VRGCRVDRRLRAADLTRWGKRDLDLDVDVDVVVDVDGDGNVDAAVDATAT
jgi:hypothetical protein